LAGLGTGGTPATFTKNGYNFTYVAGGTQLTTSPVLTPPCATKGWTQASVNSLPMSVGGTGQRGFNIDNSGVITYSTNGTAPIAGSPVL